MIWLSWRQFRAQTLTALGLLAVLVIGLVVLGLQMRHSWNVDVVGCEALDNCGRVQAHFRDQYQTPVSLLSLLLLVVPAILGAFWGAPLIARELETGTHRLAWTQSVTRTRWLAAKLGVVLLTGVVVAAAFALLLTWASDPFDDLAGTRFGALNFGSRNVVPIGYAVFALVLGVTIGLLVKRTLAAMAITIAAFIVVQIAMPFFIRPHLMPPVEESVAVNRASLARADGFGLVGEPPLNPDAPIPAGTTMQVDGYEIPGAWVLPAVLTVLDASDDPADPNMLDECFRRQGGPAAAGDCLATKNLHFNVSYHPGSRYWPFQGIELAIFTVLAAVLAGFCFRRIPRVVG